MMHLILMYLIFVPIFEIDVMMDVSLCDVSMLCGLGLRFLFGLLVIVFVMEFLH